VAGRGSDGCGVQLHHSFAEFREVASEECPTGIGELGVKRQHRSASDARATHSVEVLAPHPENDLNPMRRRHGGQRSCAFMNEQSSRGVFKEARARSSSLCARMSRTPPSATRRSRGVFKEAGACALTLAVREGVKDSTIRYTKCAGCKRTMCCSCLDSVASVVLEYAMRVDFNSRWAALLARPWCAGLGQPRLSRNSFRNKVVFTIIPFAKFRAKLGYVIRLFLPRNQAWGGKS
jgi:hypothetical protein